MKQVAVVLGCRPSERAWPPDDGGNLVWEDFHSNSRKGRTCRRGSFASFRVRQRAFVWMVSLLDSREHAQDAQRRIRKHSVRHPTLAVRGCAAAAGEEARLRPLVSMCIPTDGMVLEYPFGSYGCVAVFARMAEMSRPPSGNPPHRFWLCVEQGGK